MKCVKMIFAVLVTIFNIGRTLVISLATTLQVCVLTPLVEVLRSLLEAGTAIVRALASAVTELVNAVVSVVVGIGTACAEVVSAIMGVILSILTGFFG